MTELGFEIPSQTSFKRSHRSRPGTTGGRASDVPGVEKDQYGRYILPPPSDPTAEPIPWTSVTTIVGQASGNEGLRIWTERGIMDGLAASPALRAQLANSTQADRDRIREEAKTLSGLHDAREWGSACHREWESWARMGAGYPGPPPELAADVTAGITAVLEAGLEVVKVEQVVVIEHLQVAGRLDNLFRAPNGKLRVGDWKTGNDVLTASSKREGFACQFSGYANCTHLRHDDGTYQVADELDIDREIAYLIHVHNGTARIYEVPIADAWRDFQARAITHRHSSSKGAPQFLAIGRPVRFVADATMPEPLEVTEPSDWPQQYAERVPEADPNPAMTQLGMALTGQDDPDVAPVPEEPTTPADPSGGTDEGTSEASTPLNGIGEPLQPLAKDVGAKRGCGVCGRIGHKRGSAACLGDSDPLATPVPVPAGVMACGPDGAVTHLSEDDTATVADFAESLKAPFATLPASDDEWCDGTCTPVAGVIPDVGAMIEPKRDDSGNVTGSYICASCYRPATVAAVRAHLAAVRTSDGYVKPDEPAEQQAAKERVVQPATIPDPPAQNIQWGKIFSACTTREQLAAEVSECQRLGQFTPERKQTAATLWGALPDEG